MVGLVCCLQTYFCDVDTAGDGQTLSGGLCSLHHNPLPRSLHIGTKSHRLLTVAGMIEKIHLFQQNYM